jgi:hypothetical protein
MKVYLVEFIGIDESNPTAICSTLEIAQQRVKDTGTWAHYQNISVWEIDAPIDTYEAVKSAHRSDE